MPRRNLSQALPSAAVCVLYREMLALAATGLGLEVLAVPNSWSEPSYSKAASMPRSALEVRKCLREGFINPALVADPFAALRVASAHSLALHPRSESMPEELPAFVLPSHLMLPGERADFVLFEPRYVALAKHVLATATERLTGATLISTMPMAAAPSHLSWTIAGCPTGASLSTAWLGLASA